MLSEQKNSLFSMLHFVGLCSAFLSVLFVVNNFLIFGFNAPGVINVLGLNKILGVESLKGGYSGGLYIVGLVQTAAVFGVIFWACFHTIKKGQLRLDAARLDWLSAYVIRAAFWAVLIVGVADAIMSFMRVEDFHKRRSFGNRFNLLFNVLKLDISSIFIHSSSFYRSYSGHCR